MTSRTRERAARIFLASLLTSDLTLPELQQLSEEMFTSPEFLSYVSLLLREVTHRLTDPGSRKEPGTQGDPSSLTNSIRSAIQRRRLSKAAVLDLMAHISPDIMRRAPQRDAPMRQLIGDFLSRASQEEADGLLRLIRSGGSDDAYLHGILKRS